MTYRKTFTYQGKRYDIRAHSQDELYEKVAIKKLELKEGTIKESDMLIRDYCKMWYRTFKEPFIMPLTQRNYRTAFNKIDDYIGYKKLKHITATDVQSMFNSEFKQGRSKDHLKKLQAVLNQVFSQAVRDRKIHSNPMDSVILPNATNGHGRAVTSEEREAILKIVDTHRYGTWVKVMLYLGLRPIETASIQGKDIDLENHTLHVRGTKTRKADRYVPIPVRLLDDFRGFDGEQYMFVNEIGNPLTGMNRYRWWHRFCQDLDIEVPEDLTAYCLRHTFGTDGQAAGIPIDVLADLMGHESINTTRKYYIHDNAQSRQRATDMLEDYYASL